MDTNSIDATCTTGAAAIPTGTLTVIKEVVNTGGGTAVPSDFTMHVKLAGSEVAGSPAAGSAFPGTPYTLIAPNSYTISEDANAEYTSSFAGACDPTGAVTLLSGGADTCVVTNTYIIPPPPVVVSFGGNYGHVIPTPVPVVVPPTVIIPAQIIVPIVLPPMTTTNEIDPITPHLPNTGFPPQKSSSSIPLISVGALGLAAFFSTKWIRPSR